MFNMFVPCRGLKFLLQSSTALADDSKNNYQKQHMIGCIDEVRQPACSTDEQLENCARAAIITMKKQRASARAATISQWEPRGGRQDGPVLCSGG